MSFNLAKITAIVGLETINNEPFPPESLRVKSESSGIPISQDNSSGDYFIPFTNVYNGIVSAFKQAHSLFFNPSTGILFTRSIQYPGFSQPDAPLEIRQNSKTSQDLTVENINGDINIIANKQLKIKASNEFGRTGDVLTNIEGIAKWKPLNTFFSQNLGDVVNITNNWTHISVEALKYKIFKIAVPSGLVVLTVPSGLNITTNYDPIPGFIFDIFICNPSNLTVELAPNTNTKIFGSSKTTSFIIKFIYVGEKNWEVYY